MGSRLPTVSPLDGRTRIEGIRKPLIRVSDEAVGIALMETQREVNALCVFLCIVPSI